MPDTPISIQVWGIASFILVRFCQSLLADKRKSAPHLNRNVLYALLVFSLYKNETLRFDTVEFP